MQEKIESFFDKAGISPNKETGRSFIFDCPVCGSKDKLYIEKNTGRGVCFRHKQANCPSAKTGVVKTMHLLTKLPIDQIARDFSNTVTSTPTENLEQDLFSTKKIEDILLPLEVDGLPVDANPIFFPEENAGLQYLKSRGLDTEQLSHLGVMYSESARRVIFPVIMNNKLYGWQGRAVDQDNFLRMYNLPGKWKAKTLMFHDNLNGSNHVIIAEGAVSALKFGLVGGYVATMGKSISKDQLTLITQSGKKHIYLALDPDATTEMEDLYKYFKTLPIADLEIYLIKVPEGKDDFGDCSYEECRDAFNTAERLDSSCMGLYVYQSERLI
jgi:hypothetical protein